MGEIDTWECLFQASTWRAFAWARKTPPRVRRCLRRETDRVAVCLKPVRVQEPYISIVRSSRETKHARKLCSTGVRKEAWRPCTVVVWTNVILNVMQMSVVKISNEVDNLLSSAHILCSLAYRQCHRSRLARKGARFKLQNKALLKPLQKWQVLALFYQEPVNLDLKLLILNVGMFSCWHVRNVFLTLQFLRRFYFSLNARIKNVCQSDI